MTRPDDCAMRRIWRRPKAHPRDDLRHTLAVGLPIAAVLFVALPMLFTALNRMAEARWYRDLVAITPFHDVIVTETVQSSRGAAISGEMIKRRCEYLALSAYVRAGQAWERAPLDNSPEDARRPPGNRPSLPDAQLWGPWVIVWTVPDRPEEWAVYAHHRCPEGDQINLFARGPWPR